jgi:hypothetical protein
VKLKASKLGGDVAEEATEEQVAFAILALFAGLSDRSKPVGDLLPW